MTDTGVRGFKAPKRVLGQLDTDAVGKLIATAADVSLILDRKGVILDVAFGNRDFEIPGFKHWVGKSWSDTVTIESKPKVEAMLAEATDDQPSRWRQVNYSTKAGDDIPVLYSVVKVGSKGRVIVLGRELQSMAQLQQRLMSAQLSVEREYSRLRQLETRYKLLFQIATEAVVIIDASSHRVIEVNPTGQKLLARGNRRIVGSSFLRNFDNENEANLLALLNSVRARGEMEETVLTIKGKAERFVAAASLMRQEDSTLFLIRLSPENPMALSGEIQLSNAALLGVVEKIPDGFVISGADGTIHSANSSFLDMVQAATEEQVKGRPLEDFFGRQGVDLAVLIGSLREHGSVRNFATTLRTTHGTVDDIEVSAAAVANGDESSFGLTIRPAVSRSTHSQNGDSHLPRSVEEMTKLVGRVPLKDLVRETTDIIEKLCIEAALELTQDNRASAAEMLGLSRQALYTKLRRYGLIEQDDGYE
ncbi:MAG: transcriptional regulator PpsR [Pseudomonadota bacterium]